jgi:hypothetical protein
MRTILFFALAGWATAAFAADQPAPGTSPVSQTQEESRPDQWRYRWHNGQWWYYQPDGRWLIYQDNHWSPYTAPTASRAPTYTRRRSNSPTYGKFGTPNDMGPYPRYWAWQRLYGSGS